MAGAQYVFDGSEALARNAAQWLGDKARAATGRIVRRPCRGVAVGWRS